MRSIVAILCVVWIIGIAFGVFSLAPILVALLVGFCVLCMHRASYSVQVLIAVATVALLGVVYGRTTSNIPHLHCDFQTPFQATLTQVRGVYARYTLSVFTRDDDCSILVYDPRYPVLIEGARVSIGGKNEYVGDAFRDFPGYAKFLQEDDIDLVIRNPQITLETQGASVFSNARFHAMSVFGKLFGEPDASILIAMMIGDRGMIPRSVKDSFQRSGITHILSISGFHVSLLAGVLALILWRLPVPSWIHYGIVGGILWTYIVAIGAPPAAIRAGLFWTLIIIAYRVRALVGLPTSIILTLCFVLTSNPLLASSISFQLSVASVAGIGVGVLFLRRIWVHSRFHAIGIGLAVSLGATCATLPLTAYYFGDISIIGVFVNIIVVPLVAILMYVALCTLLLYMIFPPLGFAISLVSHVLMKALLLVAAAGASVPYGSFQHIVFPLWAVGVYYAVVGAMLFFAMRMLHIRFREIWV